jgi:uncharacterized membrane protein (UPF0127 family)
LEALFDRKVPSDCRRFLRTLANLFAPILPSPFAEPIPAVTTMTQPFSIARRLAPMAACLLASAALLCAPLQASAQSPQGPQSLPTQQLRAGMYLIQAEVANSSSTREIGLMFRTSLPPNHGMLFIFDSPDTQCMWMRNTFIPLSVAFIADDGTILNIEEMVARTENSHCAVKPVKYALEMDSGWFSKHGFKAGSKIDGIAGH